MHAQAQDWKRVPAPQQTAPLNFQALFTDVEAEQMRQGIIPKHMEDKWFIYFEGGWLRFHRSWTGFFIYALRLDGSPAGVRVTDSWVNREPEQYASTDLEYDRNMLRYLIDVSLLKKQNVPFPTR
ncbi:hypothetical protein F6Q07_01670 [Pectobacterium parmentieri]|uniref:hypothetical protein n=1 Tax=Pectobacterium parmentieri TaxID=1905730 RepID=UPI0001B0E092|nr:hypothetical protein [Pectobacterium parmentieri]ACX88377.1 conserved hypothetical protein [Pectobacterium parmentieri WPP163]AYH01802.1 hypothetical protein C5E26_13115 [Pectobacterium parmentieri]AYH28069.1 hypothetical protein C5E20_13520 [Pectobacterium parmentieri]AYH32374.1 hypothetical protein C5E19_12545 [Pectobacterium parmentieri]MBI0470487.1 hypothetical protein [Pectobacterium parmentieri]